MIPQRIHDQACLRERSLALGNLPFGEDDLKILAYLLQEFTLQVGDIPAKRRNLVYRPIALEVCHELDDGLQQLRTLPVLARLAQAP